MAVTVDCWIRESVDQRPLPAQVGSSKCHWNSATSDSAVTERLYRVTGEFIPNPRDAKSDRYVAWFDTVRDLEVSWDSFARGLEHLNTHPDCAAVWLVSANDPWSQLLYRNLPAPWASLCLTPSHPVQVLFRRGQLARAGATTESTHPGWMAAAELWLRTEPIAAVLPQTERWDQLPADRLPALTPTTRSGGQGAQYDWLQTHLATLARRETPDLSDQAALQAGVWQCQGELDLSHRLAQEHEGQGTNQLCDYWHAIMHRREPDYGNSKYWFRQLGRHPVFALLSERAAELLMRAAAHERVWERRLLRAGTWDPFGMVDLAEAAAEDPTLDPLARRLQSLEMCVLWEALLRQTQSTRAN